MEKTVLLPALIIVAAICSPAISDSSEETDELRAMLRQSMAQNRKLENQMGRLKLVWSGLNQMCKTIGMQECSCEDCSDESAANSKSEPEKTSALKVVSVQSSGNKSNSIGMSVTYFADDDHVTEWMAGYKKYSPTEYYMSDGDITNLGQGKFETSFTLADADSLEFLIVRMYSGRAMALVQFDIHQVTIEGTQLIPDYISEILSLNYTHTAPKEGDMTIPMVVNGNLHQSTATEQMEVYFSGVNASSEPPALYEVSSYSGRQISWSGHQKTNNTSTIKIKLGESLLGSGGTLVIRLPQKEITQERLETDLVEKLSHGYLLDILSADTGKVVPEKTIGIMSGDNITLTISKGSLWCGAMGDPEPDMQIYRVLKDGRWKKLKTSSLVKFHYMSTATLTLSANDPKAEGLYVCRASSGSTVVDDYRSVTVYKPARFAEAKTGVLKNTTDKVVFSCKATSSSNPELEFRLYENNGPKIEANDLYTISTKKIGKRTSRIFLTVSPPDENLHTVVCVARTRDIEEYKQIHLFPGTQREWDWNLYNGMQCEICNLTLNSV